MLCDSKKLKVWGGPKPSRVQNYRLHSFQSIPIYAQDGQASKQAGNKQMQRKNDAIQRNALLIFNKKDSK